MTLPLVDQTLLTRPSKRQLVERQGLHNMLDAGLVTHVAVVHDGVAVVLPVGYRRDGDAVLLHGSAGGDLLREAAAGAPVTVSVTVLDGPLYARSPFDSSMNYRTVLIVGLAEVVTRPAKVPALRLLSEHLMPGRWDEVREPTDRERAGVLACPDPVGAVAVLLALVSMLSGWCARAEAAVPAAGERRRRAAAGTRWVLVLTGAAGYGSLACIEVATLARLGARGAATVLDAWSGASLLEGVLVARADPGPRVRPGPTALPLVAYPAMVVLDPCDPVVFAGIPVLGGVGVAPTLAAVTAEVARVTPGPAREPAFAWLQSGCWDGSAAATAVAWALAVRAPDGPLLLAALLALGVVVGLGWSARVPDAGPATPGVPGGR